MQRVKERLRKLNGNFTLPVDLTPLVLDKLKKISPSFKRDYLLSNVTTKFVSRDTAPSEVRRSRAINKWLATEANNAATNERLMSVDPEYNILPRVTYERFMNTVRSVIIDVLGEVVPEEALMGSFSGGASTSRPRTRSHPGDKYTGKADVTFTAVSLAHTLLTEYELWGTARSIDEYHLVEGNVLFTVPKTADIDRCACKEPDINMYFQKGVGDFIRNRLRYFGIDLNDQTRNQGLARLGSQDSSLATVDLSSASDSISYELVFQCLPTLWFSLLADLRSPITIIDGDRHVNEMFSSMGNGFTFELESLLFYAIARAVAYHTGTPGVISVYGDDIIVPTQMCPDLIFVLAFLGFETNKDKTFFEGYFRESCGGHYYHGRDVTPFYIRKPIDTLHDVITLANQLRRWARVEGLSILDCEVADLWTWLVQRVPKCFWGGYDTNDSSRLVSYAFYPKKPKKLSPITKMRRNDSGTYLLWHNLKARSPDMETEVSIIPHFTGVYRSKSIRHERRWPEHAFLDEVRIR